MTKPRGLNRGLNRPPFCLNLGVVCQSRQFAEIFPKKPSDHVACVPPRVPHITWRPLRTGFEVNCYSIHQRIVGRHYMYIHVHRFNANPEKRRRVRKNLWSVHCPCILACLPACLRRLQAREKAPATFILTSAYLTHTS